MLQPLFTVIIYHQLRFIHVSPLKTYVVVTQCHLLLYITLPSTNHLLQQSTTLTLISLFMHKIIWFGVAFPCYLNHSLSACRMNGFVAL